MRALLLLLGWLAFAPATFAHAMLERAEPAVGATLQAAPHAVTLHFSEGVEPALCRVTLSDEAGRAVALGPAHTAPDDRRTLIAEIPAALAPGTYRVTWRAVSVDSHVTGGDFHFVLTR